MTDHQRSPARNLVSPPPGNIFDDPEVQHGEDGHQKEHHGGVESEAGKQVEKDGQTLEHYVGDAHKGVRRIGDAEFGEDEVFEGLGLAGLRLGFGLDGGQVFGLRRDGGLLVVLLFDVDDDVVDFLFSLQSFGLFGHA